MLPSVLLDLCLNFHICEMSVTEVLVLQPSHNLGLGVDSVRVRNVRHLNQF